MYCVASSVTLGFVYNIYVYIGAIWWNVAVGILAWMLLGWFGKRGEMLVMDITFI